MVMLNPKEEFYKDLSSFAYQKERYRANSLEKTLMLEKIEGRKRRGQQRMRWLDGVIDSMTSV